MSFVYLYNETWNTCVVLVNNQLNQVPLKSLTVGSLDRMVGVERNGYRLCLRDRRVVCRNADGTWRAAEARDDAAALQAVVVDAAAGLYAVQADGLYLCAERNQTLTFSRTTVGRWERFRGLTPRAAEQRVYANATHSFAVPRSFRMVRARSTEGHRNTGVLHRRARVLALDWTVLSPRLTPHAATVSHMQRLRSAGNILLPKASQEWVESAILLGGYTNYYHHLVDYMLNFIYVKELAEKVPLLVLAPQLPFHGDIFNYLGVSQALLPVDPLTVTKVRSLLVPPKAVIYDGLVRDRRAVRDFAAHIHALSSVQRGPKRRLLISREAARVRRAVNEAEMQALAAKYDFETLILERMSFAEQAAAFRDASVVLGLHGAGFANLVLTSDKCHLIEVLPDDPEWRPEYFRNLTKGLGYEFTRLDVKGRFNSTQLSIDLTALAKILDQLPKDAPLTRS